jgi:hypothetical protein
MLVNARTSRSGIERRSSARALNEDLNAILNEKEMCDGGPQRDLADLNAILNR